MRIFEMNRLKRIEEILELLNRVGEKEKGQLITAICVKYGVSRRTAADYLLAAKMKMGGEDGQGS